MAHLSMLFPMRENEEKTPALRTTSSLVPTHSAIIDETQGLVDTDSDQSFYAAMETLDLDQESELKDTIQMFHDKLDDAYCTAMGIDKNELAKRTSPHACKAAWNIELDRRQAYKDGRLAYQKRQAELAALQVDKEAADMASSQIVNADVDMPMSLEVKNNSNAPKAEKQDVNFALRHASWLKWKLETNTVFENQKEEMKAFKRCNIFGGSDRKKTNMMFQYGLRYIPQHGEPNTHRAVIIDFVPEHMNLCEILHNVRGGAIHSAYLGDTMAINGFKTAKITFVHQDGALNFFKRAQNDGFYVGMKILPAYVIRSPSYPPELTSDTEAEKTRCLKVQSTRLLKRHIHGLLNSSHLATSVDSFGSDDAGGEVSIRFISVDAALLAADILRSNECTVTFGDDPCAA